jgi:hypothetical protein
MALAPGTRLGPYATESAIGAGGIGEVSSRLRFGTPRPLFQTNTGTQGGLKPYSPAPDGQCFLVATPAGEASPAPLTLLVRRWNR